MSDQGLTKCVCNNHRSGIHQYINFLFENYGNIYKLCTYIVSPKDHTNPELYYSNSETDIRDLTYSGLSPILFLLFFLM